MHGLAIVSDARWRRERGLPRRCRAPCAAAGSCWSLDCMSSICRLPSRADGAQFNSAMQVRTCAARSARRRRAGKAHDMLFNSLEEKREIMCYGRIHAVQTKLRAMPAAGRHMHAAGGGFVYGVRHSPTGGCRGISGHDARATSGQHRELRPWA